MPNFVSTGGEWKQVIVASPQQPIPSVTQSPLESTSVRIETSTPIQPENQEPKPKKRGRKPKVDQI